MISAEGIGRETSELDVETATRSLHSAYLKNHPWQAALTLAAMPPQHAASILMEQPTEISLPVWLCFTSATGATLLPFLTDEVAAGLLARLDAGPCASLLGQLAAPVQARYLALLDDAIARELTQLLDFPEGSAGKLMDPRVLGLNAATTVAHAMSLLGRYPAIMRRRIYILNDHGYLLGQVELSHLVVADPEQTLAEIGSEVSYSLSALAPAQEVSDLLQKNNIEALPILDPNGRLLGVIRGESAVEALKQGLVTEMQTMVGASREERALSSSWFAVRKRQGWLQVNLLTGFLAAAVVGMFESTIAQFTALAVLMPVAAGQSGNTGAQALAVTMRGLTLREITVRHWFRVMWKEAGAGFLNGLAIALTCSIGVYFWSGNLGLALVIALAMVISMTIAGVGGALVPICLQKLGQDPAQSSSIILTTITDIAGFMSFLGIATLLATMLVQ